VLSTIVVVAVFVSLVMLQIVLWAIFLHLALLWSEAAGATTRRIAAATTRAMAVQLAAGGRRLRD
jgi:hypothetical protein